MRVRIDSLGCRLNIGEASRMARRFARWGHRVVGPGDPADLLILNTCAVTHIAARKSRKLVRALRRTNPGARFVVTGCYAELSPAEVESLGVDLVVGNADKDELPELLVRQGLIRDAEPVPTIDQGPLRPGPGRTRAFVKVQDGCDNRCTFCIVTVARGTSRSRPATDVIEEINELVDLGYNEAVLSGVHLGAYGHDLGLPGGLATLVSEILNETEIPRLRLSSLEPWDLDRGFFDLWQDPRLQPHLHLPLQSGSDATLQRMARRTDRESFAALMEQARAAIPDVAVTTDIIVGFPGETEDEFEQSIELVEAMRFARLHVFRYSPREGTAAAAMPDRPPHEVGLERSRRMHALGERLECSYRLRHVGRRMPVLWETHEPGGQGKRWTGLTGNYLRVVTETDPQEDLHNSVTDTELVGQVPGAMLGSTKKTLPEFFAA